jgi:hypothetical protein
LISRRREEKNPSDGSTKEWRIAKTWWWGEARRGGFASVCGGVMVSLSTRKSPVDLSKEDFVKMRERGKR